MKSLGIVWEISYLASRLFNLIIITYEIRLYPREKTAKQ